jgi:hypothetical protein
MYTDTELHTAIEDFGNFLKFQHNVDDMIPEQKEAFRAELMDSFDDIIEVFEEDCVD